MLILILLFLCYILVHSSKNSPTIADVFTKQIKTNDIINIFHYWLIVYVGTLALNHYVQNSKIETGYV